MNCVSRLNLTNFVCLGIMLLLSVSGCRKDLPKPKNYPVICYAATYSNGINRSDNGGTSWFPVDIDQEVIYSYFKGLYKSPVNRNIFYVTTTGVGLFELNLQAGRLEQIALFNDGNITSVAFQNILLDEHGSKNILAATNGQGIYELSNEPGTWRPLNNGLTYHDVNILFPRGNDLFAGTVEDLFKWDETSRQWKSTSEGIKNKNIISISADPQDKTLYVGSGSYGGEKGRFEDIPCLYKSTDNDHLWVASDKGIPDGTLVYIIVVNPKRSERIYLGTSDGIYRSIDKGETWAKMENGLPRRLKVFDIKIAQMPDGKDVVYAVGSNGIFMTTDDEETLWVNKSYGLPQTAITSIILISQE